MLIPQCHFCDHINPTAAKYCNECGSPLHLKPCKQCEAINDGAAKTCYNCGTADPALVITSDAAATTADVESVATVTSGEVSLERERLPLPEPIAESQDVRPGSLAGDMSLERERLSLPEPIADSQEVRSGWPAGDATARDAESDVDAAVRAPQSSGTHERSLVSETLDAMPASVSQNLGAMAKRRLKFRTAMAALPPILLLSAVAVLAYYAYSHPVQLREWLSAARAMVSPAGGGTPIPVSEPSSARTSFAPMARVDPVSVAAMELAAPRPTNEPATEITVSPVAQGSESATGAAGDNGRTPTSNQTHAAVASQPKLSTREQETAAAGASRAEKKASTGTKTNAKKSRKASTRKPTSARAAASSKASTEPLAP